MVEGGFVTKAFAKNLSCTIDTVGKKSDPYKQLIKE